MYQGHRRQGVGGPPTFWETKEIFFFLLIWAKFWGTQKIGKILDLDPPVSQCRTEPWYLLLIFAIALTPEIFSYTDRYL